MSVTTKDNLFLPYTDDSSVNILQALCHQIESCKTRHLFFRFLSMTKKSSKKAQFQIVSYNIVERVGDQNILAEGGPVSAPPPDPLKGAPSSHVGPLLPSPINVNHEWVESFPPKTETFRNAFENEDFWKRCWTQFSNIKTTIEINDFDWPDVI